MGWTLEASSSPRIELLTNERRRHAYYAKVAPPQCWGKGLTWLIITTKDQNKTTRSDGRSSLLFIYLRISKVELRDCVFTWNSIEFELQREMREQLKNDSRVAGLPGCRTSVQRSTFNAEVDRSLTANRLALQRTTRLLKRQGLNHPKKGLEPSDVRPLDITWGW